MRPSRLRLSLVAFALTSGIATRAQTPPTVPVTISVSDLTGAGIAHAVVRITPEVRSPPVKMETDQAGELQLQLTPRVYEISATAQGFKLAKQLIRITASQNAKAASQIVSIILDLGNWGGPVVAYPAGSLVINGGSFDKVTAYSAAQFAALPHVSLTLHNAHSNADETYSGVPLATLLDKLGAPLGNDLRGDAMARYLLATGSDGYTVALSLAEVDPSFHAGQVIVADTRDGQPLGDHGPFQLIVSDDKRPARWVRNLTSIALATAR